MSGSVQTKSIFLAMEEFMGCSPRAIMIVDHRIRVQVYGAGASHVAIAANLLNLHVLLAVSGRRLVRCLAEKPLVEQVMIVERISGGLGYNFGDSAATGSRVFHIKIG